MKLEEMLGDAYKPGMTLEELESALADKTFVDAATLQKQISKETFDKTASELAALKKQLKEIQSTSMTEEQRYKQAMEEANLEKSRYQKELVKLKAKDIFTTAGLGENDFGSILDGIITENEEQTIKLAQSMVGLLTAQKTAAEKALRAELLKDVPKPPAGGNPPKPITKDEFDKMDWKARTELKQTNPELFKSLSS